MMAFSDIPNRSNMTRILREWFDALRDAGELLENWIGTGFISETSFACANNQVAASNVTGLLFSGSTVKSAFIDYQIYRKTDSVESMESGSMIAIYKSVAASWSLSIVGAGGDDAGVTFTITSGGQVQYTSTNLAGTYDAAASKIKFKARTIGA